MKEQSLVKGTFILAIAGFLNKALGFGLRMVLVRIIGDEGLGLFQRVFPLFISFSIIITIGLPVALAKFIPPLTKKKDRVLELFYPSLVITLLSSIIVTITFISSSSYLATTVLQDQRTYYILLFIAPALIFSALASILRGFFQGFRLMTPTAISQIVEQLFRIIATLIILTKTVNLSLDLQAAGVALGITIGQLFGFLILIFFFFYYCNDFFFIELSISKIKQSSTKLIRFGLPITLSRLIASLLYTIEATIIPAKLTALGYSISQATSFYGQLSGMVQQLIYLPTIITIALNTNLIPNIAKLMAEKKYDLISNKIEYITKLITYIGFLTSAIFISLGEEICQLLFNYPQAGQPLKILALTAVFVYLSQSFSGILQGMGKPNQVVINLVIALVIELALIQTTTLLPVQSAPLVITAAIGVRQIITAILHLRIINQIVTIYLDFKNLIIKPLLAKLIIVVTLPRLYQLIYHFSANNLLSLVSAITFSAIFFLLFLLLSNALNLKDLTRFLPDKFLN